MNFPDALYIWPFGYERFHCYKLFMLCKKVDKAEIAFLCDNFFDVWINGRLIDSHTSHLQLTDITEYVKLGENNLHIRGYQSGTDEGYSSAITGGIRIYYTDGSKEEFVTDDTFKQMRLVDFWETEEPEGFETAKDINISDMNVMELHPRALRRSFYFIRPFNINKKLTSAKLFATALGCYEPYLNGNRIVDSFFMPFCHNYQKEYQEYDILNLLHTGKNVLGMITGNGTYNCSSWGRLTAKLPEVMAIVELEYEDGEKEQIYTDDKWLCAPSPLIENDIQYGERYDARMEIAEWCSENVDISKFTNVSSRKNEEHQKLLQQNYPMIKKIKEYTPEDYRCLSDNSILFDIGVCIAGRARIILKNLSRGDKVRIRYCERLTEDGNPENGAYTTVHYQQDCAPDGISSMFMRNMDVYIAKGIDEEVYECRFAYTGFRYVWIEGLNSVNQIVRMTAFELHNDLIETGNLFTHNDSINQIFKATKRAWLNNIFNGPTDCPTREKNYWNGDAQIFSNAACWLTDNSAFLSRWTDNGIKMHPGPYAWEDETYEIPWTLYKFYGDVDILRKRFPMMLKLVDKRTEFEGMILPEKDTHQYCDWLSPTGITPNKQFFCGCWYYHMLVRVADIAEILCEKEICAELRHKAKIAKDEFNHRHFNKAEFDYDAKNQCGIILPLAFGLAPEEHKDQLAERLVEYIKEENYHVTTGFIGTRYFFDVLTEHGYGEVAYKILSNKTFPSWMNMLSTGATSITESWFGEKDPDISISMSHFSLGSFISWFFEYLGGIRIKESKPGFSEVVLKPIVMKQIGSFAITYQTKYGDISTKWYYEGDVPVFEYSVPPGVTVLECSICEV